MRHPGCMRRTALLASNAYLELAGEAVLLVDAKTEGEVLPANICLLVFL